MNNINNEIYQNNMDLLQNYDKSLYEKVYSSEFNELYKIQKARNDSYTVIIDKEPPFILHSLYNPEKEAIKKVDVQKVEKYDILVINGLGLGYIAFELIKRISKHNKLIINEHDISLFKLAISVFDFTEIIKHDNIIISVDEPKIEYQFKLQSFLQIHPSANIKYFYIPNLYELNEIYYTEHNKALKEYVGKTFTGLNTTYGLRTASIRNFFINSPLLFEGYSAILLQNIFKNKPCILVHAGPSLEHSYEKLKNIQDNAIIIAVDAVYSSLLKRDIKPDFVVGVDPNLINFFKFINVPKNDKVAYVGYLTSWHKIFHYFPDNVFFLRTGHTIINRTMQLTTKLLGLHTGGSVSTLGMGLAVFLGCDPITHIGLDLAFTYGSSHIKDRLLPTGNIEEINEFNTIDHNNWFFQHRYSNKFNFKVKAIDGKELITSSQMYNFRLWFEEFAHKVKDKHNLYNSTYYGAEISGYEYITFNEFIDKFCNDNLGNKYGIIDNTKKIANQNISIDEKQEKILSFYEKTLENLYNIKKQIKKGVNVTNLLVKCLKKKDLNYNKIKRNMKKFTFINNSLEDYKFELRYLHEYSPAQALTYKKEISEVEDNDDDILLAETFYKNQNNYYSTLLETADFYIDNLLVGIGKLKK